MEKETQRYEERVSRGGDVKRGTRGTGGYLVLETGAFIFPPARVWDNVCLIRAKRTWGSQLNGLVINATAAVSDCVLWRLIISSRD